MPVTKANKKNTKVTKVTKGRKTAKKQVEHARDKIDMKQTIYISVPRVSNRFDKFGINETITVANEELRNGEPHLLVDKETKKETMTVAIPLENMSASTQELLEQATARYDNTQSKRMENLEKKKEKLGTDWAERQVFLAGQLASKQIKKEELTDTLATEQDAFDLALAAVESELKTPPQLINKKKKHHSDYEQQMALIQKMRYRISKDVSTTTAAACTIWICELLRHGMNNVVAQDKSFLKCQHIFTDGLDTLKYLPFYQRLPTFLAGQQAELDRRVAEEEKKRNRNKKKKEAAEAKKAAADAGTTVVAPVEAEVVETETVDDEGDDTNEVKFNHHIKQTCLYLQKSLEDEGMSPERLESFQSIRISEEIKTCCSNLISEFNGTLINLIQAELDKTKITTVNVSHIHHALRLFLLVNNNDPEPLIEQVEEMTGKYNDHQSEKNEDRKAKAAIKAAEDAAEEAAAASEPVVATST